MTAWKESIKCLSDSKPLLISVLNPVTAEIYMEAEKAANLRESLDHKGYLLKDSSPLQEKDLVRRKSDYLHGYFLPLRRAALRGFDLEQQMKLLQLAEADLSRKVSDPILRKRWKYQIAKDRDWIRDQSPQMAE
jgi:hypothetical protein